MQEGLSNEKVTLYHKEAFEYMAKKIKIPYVN
jgi:hypothetical protein